MQETGVQLFQEDNSLSGVWACKEGQHGSWGDAGPELPDVILEAFLSVAPQFAGLILGWVVFWL